MNWDQAEAYLKNKIYKGQKLTSKGKYKIVVENPPYRCKSFNTSECFKIQIGKNNYLYVAMDILYNLFEVSISNGGIYDMRVFKSNYSNRLKSQPSFFPTTCMLFYEAKVMVPLKNNTFKII